jgi:phospholipase C
MYEVSYASKKFGATPNQVQAAIKKVGNSRAALAKHFRGKPGAFNQSGFRVPMIVISPWARPSFVSHTARDYTSILRLIEDTFHVPPLTLRDANADNMMEFFNFSGAPPWLVPPTLPPQPTNGMCNHSLEKAPGF